MMYEQKIKSNLNAAYSSKEMSCSTNLQLGNQQKYHDNKKLISLQIFVLCSCQYMWICFLMYEGHKGHCSFGVENKSESQSWLYECTDLKL